MYIDGAERTLQKCLNCDYLTLFAAALYDLSERCHWFPILSSPLTLMQYVVCSWHLAVRKFCQVSILLILWQIFVKYLQLFLCSLGFIMAELDNELKSGSLL